MSERSGGIDGSRLAEDPASEVAASLDLLAVKGAPDLPSLTIRRPRRDDAEYAAIAALIGRANERDGVPWRPTMQHIRDEHEGFPAQLDPAHDVCLAEVDGRIVGEASVDRVVRDGVAVFHVGGFVDPEFRRRGLGRALLRQNMRRASERAANEATDQPVELGAFAEATETGHRALLEEAGFRVIRWFFLMRRDLTRPIPHVPLPDGVELRPLLPEHHRPVFDAEVEAFLDHWGARMKTDEDFAHTYRRKEFDPSLWVVAWAGNEIAGVVQNWIWTEENAELGVQRGWLEHISVRRPFRRRGLGRAITAASLQRLRQAGMSDAMLGVDSENANGALGLYESLGFVVHSRSTAYRRDLD
jgi:mycothiol synthase